METLYTGQTLIRLNSVDSTNNYAANLINATNVREGTVIVAQRQSAGKGQRGSEWLSEPGMNLTFSVIYFPRFLAADQQFYLSKAMALAVCKVISIYQSDVKIKWPNDIFVGEKKISGMLIENSLSGQNLSHSVIGIGINVNQQSFPPELNATSLAILAGNSFQVDKILEECCVAIEQYYHLLRAKKFNFIQEEYLSHLLYYQEWASYESEGAVFDGKISDVTQEGKLLILRRDGSGKEYDLKEVRTLI